MARTAVIILLSLPSTILADCRHFFVQKQVAVVQQQVVIPAIAVSPYIYQAGRDIEADALAAKVAALVTPAVVQQLRTQPLTQSQTSPLPPPAPVAAPPSALSQHCSKCHSGALPKAGITFDGVTLLECRHVTAALRALASDKMPKDHKVPPEVKGALMEELLSLERKEELP